jgi:hypothetical protein
MLEGARTIGGDRFQPLAVFAAEDDADSLDHELRLARRAALVNPMPVSVHYAQNQASSRRWRQNSDRSFAYYWRRRAPHLISSRVL